MNLLQRIVSLILYGGHASKQVVPYVASYVAYSSLVRLFLFTQTYTWLQSCCSVPLQAKPCLLG